VQGYTILPPLLCKGGILFLVSNTTLCRCVSPTLFKKVLLTVQPSGFIVQRWHSVSRHQFQKESVRHMQKLRAPAQRKLVCLDPLQHTLEPHFLGCNMWVFLCGDIFFIIDRISSPGCRGCSFSYLRLNFRASLASVATSLLAKSLCRVLT
jgi:hypothetical protein